MAKLTITKMCERYPIKADTLRYYERIGLIPRVPRSTNGNRIYPEYLQKWVEMIICLRHSGVSVEKLVEYVELLKQGDATLQARENLLVEQRDLLLEKQRNLQRSIDRLSHKISLYQSGEIRQNKNYFEEYRIMDD